MLTRPGWRQVPRDQCPVCASTQIIELTAMGGPSRWLCANCLNPVPAKPNVLAKDKETDV